MTPGHRAPWNVHALAKGREPSAQEVYKLERELMRTGAAPASWANKSARRRRRALTEYVADAARAALRQREEAAQEAAEAERGASVLVAEVPEGVTWSELGAALRAALGDLMWANWGAEGARIREEAGRITIHCASPTHAACLRACSAWAGVGARLCS